MKSLSFFATEMGRKSSDFGVSAGPVFDLHECGNWSFGLEIFESATKDWDCSRPELEFAVCAFLEMRFNLVESFSPK
jgi:hypothetical protein